MELVETWTTRGNRSRFMMAPTSQRDYDADEAIAAECLLLLATSADDSWKRASSPNNAKKHRQLINLTTAVDHVPVVPETKKLHVCSVCGKSFGSHQALGGHQTSHRAKPQTTKVPRPISAVSQVSGMRRHECYICKEVFCSGQSLGGHMRKHYEGDLTKPKSTVSSDGSEVTSSNVAGGALNLVSSDGSGLNIDLNILPPAEDMETDAAFI